MTREEAIKNLKVANGIVYSEYAGINDDQLVNDVNEAINMAIEALEQISHLKGRPCEVCECHTENGCSEWECVFKGV